MIDPFTQVHRHIIDAISQHTAVTDIVKPRNIWDHTRDKLPTGVQQLTPNDYPALRLLPAGGDINLKANSDCANITQEYSLEISTGHPELSDTAENVKYYYPLKWALLQALQPLTGGKKFESDQLPFGLMHLQVTTADEALDDDGGTLGWISVFTLSAVLDIERRLFGAQ